MRKPGGFDAVADCAHLATLIAFESALVSRICLNSAAIPPTTAKV
ncbi:hypothetical protein ANO14919_026910 [Xylariales sp. No.14919]|nr:hypothetical protein ANO14919_026910 [Xylariales sp. No.14919]